MKRIKKRADTLEGTVMTSDVSLDQLKDDCTSKKEFLRLICLVFSFDIDFRVVQRAQQSKALFDTNRDESK